MDVSRSRSFGSPYQISMHHLCYSRRFSNDIGDLRWVKDKTWLKTVTQIVKRPFALSKIDTDKPVVFKEMKII